MLNDGSDNQYQIEPGAEEDLQVLRLLKIPGYQQALPKEEGGDDTSQIDINEELGALADKEAMEAVVKDLMQ